MIHASRKRAIRCCVRSPQSRIIAGAKSAVPGRKPNSAAIVNVPGNARSFISCAPPSAARNLLKPMPENGNFYEYAAAEPTLIPALKSLSMDAYHSCGGKGYTRIDIRQDSQTGKLYMLEVNAQCGLSEDENYTSIGAILKFSHKSFTELVLEILDDAIQRNQIA